MTSVDCTRTQSRLSDRVSVNRAIPLGTHHRRSQRPQLWWFAVLLLAAACSSTDDPAPATAAPDATGADGATNDVGDVSFVGVDVPKPTPDVDLELPSVTDIPADFGTSCDSDDDCGSGFCVDGPAGPICSMACVDNCPTGYTCETLATGTVAYVCLPDSQPICTPCDTDDECGWGMRCIEVGDEGRFCTRSCSIQDPCPADFICEAETSVEDARCVSKSLSCSCLESMYGTTEPCEVENDVGTCAGTRSCNGPGGWTMCDAATPSPDLCDGVDNDCDGETDEQTAQPYCEQSNEHGTCSGQEICLGAEGVACMASIPAAETCNGKDDDCDGETDEPGAIGCQPYFQDVDGDGFGDSLTELCLCGPTGDHTASVGGDCQDFNEAIGVGTTEICNGQDDDCDGETDEPGTDGCKDWYRDEDADGFGVETDSLCLCKSTVPYITQVPGDCDDSAWNVHPDVDEVCNDIDDNCDGETDEVGALGCVPYLLDEDNDGWGVTGQTVCGCAASDKTATQGGDCHDGDPMINPGMIEICDGLDNNCNSDFDEGTHGAPCTVENEVGSCPGVLICYGFAGSECDAPEPSPEVCNGVDDDCDGTPDNAGAAGCQVYFHDGDGDQVGDDDDTQCLCAPTAWYSATVGGDCDDSNPNVGGGSVEICNGVDDDCDGSIDEENALGCGVYFDDVDQDGFGTGTGQCLCAPSMPTTATLAGDCNDLDTTVRPNAAESCNGIDDNCIDGVDEPGAFGCAPYLRDDDDDGFGVDDDTICACSPVAPYTAVQGGDCDDATVEIAPQLPEQCNGVDDDCDGVTDENLDGMPCEWTNQHGTCTGTITCNGADGSACSAPKPKKEACGGGDENCNGMVDEPNAKGCTTYYQDKDDDGAGNGAVSQCLCAPAGDYTATVDGDCNDLNPFVAGGGTEMCNGADDDCDGLTDEPNAAGCTVFYRDADADGAGAMDDSQCRCTPGDQYVALTGTDCDDSLSSVGPGKAEVCNGADDNCDGATDEEGAVGCTSYYFDGDGDGYGTGTVSKCLCAPSGDWSATTNNDCDDTNSQVFPQATEDCDGADNNCNGQTDEGCDADGDDYCAADRVVVGSPAVCPNGGGDCQDFDATISPGAAEQCNGQDDNCDGTADENVQSPCGGCAPSCTMSAEPGMGWDSGVTNADGEQRVQFKRTFKGWPTGLTWWSQLTYDITSVAGSKVRVRVRVASTKAGLDGASWTSWTDWQTDIPYALVLSHNDGPVLGQWLEVQLRVQAANLNPLPTLDNLAVGASAWTE